MISDQPLLEGRGLRRDYSHGTVALDGVDITLKAGESLAITGPSGSGKSTLLAIIGLLETPTGGELFLGGELMTGRADAPLTRARAENLAFVFQSFHLIQHLDATENILHALRMRPDFVRLTRDQLTQQAHQMLESVGLGHRVHTRVTRLSGGEQQRVAVARALACQAPILLCDEPTGNLDSANSTAVMDLLLEAVGPEQAMVIVTHDPQIARRCDREIHLIDGRIHHERSLKAAGR